MPTTNISLLNPTEYLLTFAKIPNANFFLQGVKLPDVSFGTRVSANPIHELNWPGDKLTFDGFTATVAVDTELASYRDLFNWMQDFTRLGTAEETVSDCIVDIGATYKFYFKDAYPVGLSGFYLSSIISDAPAITFDATFKFTVFEIR